MSPAESRPVLVCFDGSEDAAEALHAIDGLLAERPVVVLTVWQPLAMRLSEVGSFGAYALTQETEVDGQEADAARQAAEDGMRRAQAAGLQATSRVEQAQEAIWRTIVDVADELDAALIVCAPRGRGPIRSALLGSVSHAVLQHAGRPVLVSPPVAGAG